MVYADGEGGLMVRSLLIFFFLPFFHYCICERAGHS